MKLFISDLDGTLLLPSENRIALKTVEAISALQAQGIRFAVASGRAQSELMHLFSPISDGVIFVACDGALIFEGEKLLYEAPMQSLSQFDKAQAVLLQGRYMTYVKGQSAFVREMKLHYRGQAIEFESAAEIDEPIYKAVVYGNGFAAEGVNKVYGDMRLAEYTAEGIDKGSAVRFLLKHYGMEKSEAAAFGDNTNDIPMLTAVEHSIAIRHAKHAVQKICKYTANNFAEAIHFAKK